MADHARRMNSCEFVQAQRRHDLEVCALEFGVLGSMMRSDASGCVGRTDEMYATKTSGTDPIVPVRSRTGRSFMPGASPNGNRAKWISPGRIHGPAVVQRIDVLAGIAQLG